MKKIYEGFDYLEMAVDCKVKCQVLRELEEVKESAQNLDYAKSLKWHFDSEEFLVRDKGRDGGYAYVLDHDIGEIWIKSAPLEEWNLRVSVKSNGFVKYGSLDNVISRLYQIFDVLCNEVNKESVSRMDYAIDYVAGDHTWNPYQFTFKSFKGMKLYNPAENSSADFTEDEQSSWEAITNKDLKERKAKPNKGKESEVQFFLTRQDCLGATFGNIKYRQLGIYDKTKEITVHRKEFWREIWANSPHYKDGDRVWRVESRISRDALRTKVRERTLDVMKETIASLLFAVFDNVKYKAKEKEEYNDTNYARAPEHSVWLQIQEDFRTPQENIIPAHTLANVRKIIDKALRDQLRAQVEGTLLTSAYLDGARTVEDVHDYIKDMYDRFLMRPNEDIEKHFDKLNNRYLDPIKGGCHPLEGDKKGACLDPKKEPLPPTLPPAIPSNYPL